MKGVILAGGMGTRLHPITRVTNKHLLPVYDKPMLFFPIHTMAEAGIREVMVILGGNSVGDIVNLLGSGKEWGIDITYRLQDEAGGIAQALGLTRNFFRPGDSMCVILGDNIVDFSIKPFVERFEASEKQAWLLLKKVADPERFGVAAFGENGEILEIVEKPQHPPSDMIVTGIYMYRAEVFKVIDTLRPSDRGELEISHVNDHYAKRGECGWDECPGEWTDAGTFESLHKASKLVAGD
jgi:glucose-1-phosphate thymidylyltransferase